MTADAPLVQAGRSDGQSSHDLGDPGDHLGSGQASHNGLHRATILTPGAHRFDASSPAVVRKLTLAAQDARFGVVRKLTVAAENAREGSTRCSRDAPTVGYAAVRRSISTTRKASSSACCVLRRGSHAVS